MRTAFELHSFKIRNQVTDQSIVIVVLISSYEVFYLHVNAGMKYTFTRAQRALNEIYTYSGRSSLVMITKYLLNHCLL